MAYKRKAQRYRTSNKRFKKTPMRRKRPSYKRKAGKSRSQFNKSVLAVIKKTAEPKYIHTNITNLSTLYHNSFNSVSLYSRDSNNAPFPMVGDGIGQRNGNEIYAKGFMLRASFCFAGDRRGTTLRMYLVNPKDNTLPLTYNNMFQNITDNVELDPLDKTKIQSSKLIGTYKIPDRSAPTLSVDGSFELIDSKVIVKKWIPFNKKISFLQDTNSPTNINSYMSLVITAYDHNSAYETDMCIKSIDMMSSFYYSDP